MFPNNHLKQTAVYWQRTGNDGYKPTFDAAEELPVRWIVKNELYRSADGQERISNAIVQVDRDLAVGDFLYLGELTDLSSGELTNPIGAEGAYEIRSFNKIPTIKADAFMRKAWL